jgi:hypothetical protein
MNIIERAIQWVQSFFVKQPEIALVPRIKLIHWIDSQYKPIYADSLAQLTYLLKKCEKEEQVLDNLILRIKNYQPTRLRIDIAQKVVTQKAILVKAAIELQKHLKHTTQISQLNEIEQFFEELQNQNDQLLKVRAQTSEVLLEYLEEYKLIMQVANILNSATRDAITIFEKSESYLLAIKQARKIEQTQHKETQIHGQIAILNHKIKLITDEIKTIEEEITDIENDPRYQLEKTGKKNQINRNNISFYELEIHKKYRLIDELQNQLTAQKEKKHYLNHNIITLNRAGAEQTLKMQIRADLNIILKLSDSDVTQYNSHN